MDPKILLFLALGCFGGFFIILIIFMLRRNKQSKSQSAVLRRMISSGTAKSSDAFYQKMYNKLVNIPFVNRYIYKIRKRLELINDDDEYLIRKETGKIGLKNIILALTFSILLAYINREDLFMIKNLIVDLIIYLLFYLLHVQSYFLLLLIHLLVKLLS